MSNIIQRDTISVPPLTTTVGAALTSVLTAYQTAPNPGQGSPGPTTVEVGIDLLKFDEKCFQLKNTGANALTSAKVQTTNIPAEQRQASDWEDFDTTTFATLAAGATKSLMVSKDCHRYWRVQAAVAAGTTIVAVLTAAGGS